MESDKKVNSLGMQGTCTMCIKDPFWNVIQRERASESERAREQGMKKKIVTQKLIRFVLELILYVAVVGSFLCIA